MGYNHDFNVGHPFVLLINNSLYNSPQTNCVCTVLLQHISAF